MWVYPPRLIYITGWLQLTQRANPGRLRDWPKNKESFGLASQWDWTLIRRIALAWHKSIFIWTNTTPGTGISQQTYPSSKRFHGSGGPAPAWDMPWQVMEFDRSLSHSSALPSLCFENFCSNKVRGRMDDDSRFSLTSLQTFAFLSFFRVLIPAYNLSVVYLAFVSYGEMEWSLVHDWHENIPGIWRHGDYFHLIADISDDRNCTGQLIATIILLRYASLNMLPFPTSNPS